MRESIAAAKGKAPRNSSTRGGSGRSQTGKNEAARKHAQNTVAYTQETLEKAKATTEEGNKVLERTMATATESASTSTSACLKWCATIPIPPSTLLGG